MISKLRSYRLRLFIVFLAGIMPFVLFDIYQLVQMRMQSAHQSLEYAKTIIQSMNKHHMVLLKTVERELSLLSRFPVLLEGDQERCHVLLHDFLTKSGIYTNIALAGDGGRLICSARKEISQVSKAAEPVFLETLQHQVFTVGKGTVSDSHGLPIIPFGYPLQNSPVPNDYVLMAGVSLQWLNEAAYSVHLTSGMKVLVLTRGNKVIGAMPSERSWLGRTLSPDVILPPEKSDDVAETDDAFWLSGEVVHDMRIIVRIDKNELYSESDKLLRQSLLMFLIMFVLAAAISGWVSQWLILREVKRLLETVLQQTRLASASELLTNIAHHWRNPLNAIALNIEALKDDIDDPVCDKKKIFDSFSKMTKILNRMSGTINNFSTLFRTDEEPQQFVFKEAIQIVEELMKPKLESGNIILDYKQIPDDLSLHSCKNVIVQVMLQLIENSIEAFNKSKQEHPLISMTAEKTGNRLIFHVEDNGGGISPDILPRVFEPYFTTKFASSGTGVSLYMVKTMIEQNFKGSIQVDNTEEGCVFTVELPLSDCHFGDEF